MLDLVFCTHDELYTCRVSGHRWVWIRMFPDPTDRYDIEEYMCDYCGKTEWVELL